MKHLDGGLSAAFRDLLRHFLWLIDGRSWNDGQGGHLPNPNSNMGGIRLQIRRHPSIKERPQWTTTNRLGNKIQ